MACYFLVIDLEATCIYPRQQDWDAEIIEIGAVILDSRLKQISEFQEFVKPVVNPILSPYCLDLLKITQGDVDTADTFLTVYERMLTWMEANGLKLTGYQNFVLVTDGIFDCNQWIRNQCKISEIEYPGWAKSFSNIKKHFMYALRTRKADRSSFTISEMTEKLGIRIDGQLHRALDDAKIVVKIMKSIRGKRSNFRFDVNAQLKREWTMTFYE
ncbi:3'-5' exoribonuclease 1-like [Antedon mediterranea]|uniref:3'-5' exoribonuclease 1-like n=1 Tax=Antedon mediterranea TaxID=105859 RepID=UPI003AF9B56A